MADFLIDLYSSNGRLVLSKRIVEADAFHAEGKARILAAAAKASFYKITCILKGGNVILRDSSKDVI